MLLGDWTASPSPALSRTSTCVWLQLAHGIASLLADLLEMLMGITRLWGRQRQSLPIFNHVASLMLW